MKIVREPKVYLISSQTIPSEGLTDFLADEQVDWYRDISASLPESLCEIAGRLCYMSFKNPRPGGNQAYLQHILEAGHGSVLEHAVWSFIITNISRSCSHELVRHRAGWSHSQLSQRYVDESTAEYIEPAVLEKDEGLHDYWRTSMIFATNSYKKLVDILLVKNKLPCSKCGFNEPVLEKLAGAKVGCPQCKQVFLISTEERKAARQAARSVLPNAAETKIFVTVNARALRHFIELRASRHAEPEIRKVAVKLLQIMQNEAPALFADYQLEALSDGTFEALTPYRKV